MRPSVSNMDRVERARTCPMLIRTWVQVGRHFDSSDYSAERTPPEARSLPIYTWRDATLGELAEQIRAAVPEARAAPGARLEFALVFPDKTGHFKVKPVGIVRGADGSEDSFMTLDRVGLQVGDFLDVAIV